MRNGERCAAARAFHSGAAARISSKARKLASPTLRIAVYSDFPYRRDGEAVYAEQAFALFLAGLAGQLEGVTLVGRLDPAGGRFPYRLPDSVGFAPLPHYPTLARPLDALRGSLAAMRAFWSVLAGDCPRDITCATRRMPIMRGFSLVWGVSPKRSN